MFSILIVLMQFIHISVLGEKYILKLLIPTLVISLLILGVFIYFAVKNNKGVKVTIKEIGLFAFGYIIIGFMVLMTLLTTNYLYDFKEPEYLTVQILEYRHHSGGKSPSYYTATVEIDGEKEKLKVYDSYIEKIEVNDYINIKVYQGLFNLKYTHVDESF
jgi:heme/copper-type cytochrome/quinol oxidase subunit 2